MGKHEPIYATAIGAGRALFGLLGLRPQVRGLANVPDHGGAVLAITHFGYLDFALVEWVTWRHNRRHIRFLAKQGAFDQPGIGPLLRGMRHISVDMNSGGEAYAQAVDALSAGELIGVFPEGGVNASFTVRELKSGAVRMATAANVPIIPIAVWGGQRLLTKNHKATLRSAFRVPIGIVIGQTFVRRLAPSGEVDAGAGVDAATLRLHDTLQGLVDDLQSRYPSNGADQWWQPAHLGGLAPTPEQAAVAEAARRLRKAQVTAERDESQKRSR